MPTQWLTNIDKQQLAMEINEKLLIALNTNGIISTTKKKALNSLINDYLQPFFLSMNDLEEREICGLCLCSFIYEQLTIRDTLSTLQMSMLRNLTSERVKKLFNKERIARFCQDAGITYEAELAHQESIETIAVRGFATLQRLGNLEQFRVETASLIERFLANVPKSQIVILIGNSPVYLYSLLSEQGYSIIILPLSGLKQCIIPSNEEQWLRLFYYLNQIFRAQGVSIQEASNMNLFCLVDYAATGGGLLAAHQIITRYLAQGNTASSVPRVNTIVIPSTLSQSYQNISQLLMALNPLMLLSPQTDVESITTQILDSKFLSKQGLRLCKQITLEDISNGKINTIPIDAKGFVALQLVMQAIMQKTTFERVLPLVGHLSQAYGPKLNALQAISLPSVRLPTRILPLTQDRFFETDRDEKKSRKEGTVSLSKSCCL